MSLILASTSASRRAILHGASVPHEAVAPGLDEDDARAALAAEGVTEPAAIAAALADNKALRISLRFPDALVLGADQLLVTADGALLNKAVDLTELAAQLRTLRGATHRLITAAALARKGVIVWRTADEARLTMRDFTEPFLERYLAITGADVLSSVGGYHLEGLGAQLFECVEGEHYTIRGLPLWPLLAELRARRILAA